MSESPQEWTEQQMQDAMDFYGFYRIGDSGLGGIELPADPVGDHGDDEGDPLARAIAREWSGGSDE